MRATFVQYNKTTGMFMGTIICEDYYAAEEERLSGHGLLQVLVDPLVRTPTSEGIEFSIDWDIIRKSCADTVDRSAEAKCKEYVTAGETQMMRYKQKEEEARAWLLDSGVSTPLLTAEATITGTALPDLVATVITMADAWIAVMATVEAKRIYAKQQISTSTNILEMVEFALVDWGL